MRDITLTTAPTAPTPAAMHLISLLAVKSIVETFKINARIEMRQPAIADVRAWCCKT
jgi:hypothetical protein